MSFDLLQYEELLERVEVGVELLPPPEGEPKSDEGGDGGAPPPGPAWPLKGPVGWGGEPALPVSGVEEAPFWESLPLFAIVPKN